MNRKERAWQGSEASLSILTREPAVVELFKILKSNRLFRRASTILSFRFTFHGIPPSFSFLSRTEKPLRYTSRIFPLNFSEISSFFLFFFFFPSQRTGKSCEESTRLFSLSWTMKIHRPLFIFFFLLGFYVASTTSRNY